MFHPFALGSSLLYFPMLGGTWCGGVCPTDLDIAVSMVTVVHLHSLWGSSVHVPWLSL